MLCNFPISFSLFILEWIFCIVSVIINLRQSRLGIENLDKLIFIIKNWPSDIFFWVQWTFEA
jgi:hypothetical protein